MRTIAVSEAALTELYNAIAASTPQAPGASSSPPAPTGAPPAAPPTTKITYTFDAAGRRIDDVMPAGTPGTVTIPVTGHTLSLPQPEANELIMGYAYRTQKQTGGNEKVAQTLGALALMQSGLKGYGPTPGHWPFMVDEFYNQVAYNPVDPATAAKNVQAWVDAQPKPQSFGDTVSVPGITPGVTEASGSAP